MSQQNYTLVTNIGREWNARAAAGETVSPITEMVFGDGDRAPVGSETELLSEVHRCALSGQGNYDDLTAAYFDAFLAADVGGFVIREHGLVTADGNLVAIGVRNPGIPKADPASGATDDFTYRIDIFFDRLDALAVQVQTLATDLSAQANRRKLWYPDTLKLISTSDWQEKTNAEHGDLQVALGQKLENSIRTHHADADGGLYLGDVSDIGDPSAAELATYTKDPLTIGDQRRRFDSLAQALLWLAFMGNHDWSGKSLAEDPLEGESNAEFLRHFPSNRYLVEWGNIVITMMGDEGPDTPGTISDATVDWWEEIVLAKQEDNFVMTCTHQSLASTINADANNPNQHIAGSERFIERMTRAENPAKPHLWLCGHHGSYAIEHLDHRYALAHGDVPFVQTGAHIPSIAGDEPERPVVFWTIHFTNGSNKVRLRQWNLTTESYEDDHEVVVTSPVPLRLRSQPQFDGRIHTHQRFNPLAQQQLSLAALNARQTTLNDIRLRVLEGKRTKGMETVL